MALLLLTMNSDPQSDWRTLPLMVNEELVCKFTYWKEQLQTGMRYGIELYTFVGSYSAHERMKAYDLACKYTLQGIDVCISTSKSTYSVWLNLRSLSGLEQPIGQAIYSDLPTLKQN